jgi:hypothetical protein
MSTDIIAPIQVRRRLGALAAAGPFPWLCASLRAGLVCLSGLPVPVSMSLSHDITQRCVTPAGTQLHSDRPAAQSDTAKAWCRLCLTLSSMPCQAEATCKGRYAPSAGTDHQRCVPAEGTERTPCKPLTCRFLIALYIKWLRSLAGYHSTPPQLAPQCEQLGSSGCDAGPGRPAFLVRWWLPGMAEGFLASGLLTTVGYGWRCVRAVRRMGCASWAPLCSLVAGVCARCPGWLLWVGAKGARARQ